MDQNCDSSDQLTSCGDFLYKPFPLVQLATATTTSLTWTTSYYLSNPSCWGECRKQLQKFHYRQQPKLWEAWQSCRRHGHTCALAAWMGQSVTNGPGEGEEGILAMECHRAPNITPPNIQQYPVPVDSLDMTKQLRKTRIPRLHIFTTAASFALRATGPPKATASSSPSRRLAAKRERSGGSKAVP